MRKQVKDNKVLVTYLNTTKMLANSLTKPLPSVKHKAFLDLLGLKDFYLK